MGSDSLGGRINCGYKHSLAFKASRRIAVDRDREKVCSTGGCRSHSITVQHCKFSGPT